MSNHDHIFMGSESLYDWKVDDVRKWLSSHTDQQSIIDAYAAVYNQAFGIEDNEYDYEEGTTAYAYACEQTDSWFSLMDELEEIVYGYLRSEGITIPEKGRIAVLAPFMDRHGYHNGSGWWIKKQ